MHRATSADATHEASSSGWTTGSVKWRPAYFGSASRATLRSQPRPNPMHDEGRVGHLQDGLCGLVQPDVRPEATPEEADPGGRRQPGDRADAIGGRCARRGVPRLGVVRDDRRLAGEPPAARGLPREHLVHRGMRVGAPRPSPLPSTEHPADERRDAEDVVRLHRDVDDIEDDLRVAPRPPIALPGGERGGDRQRATRVIQVGRFELGGQRVPPATNDVRPVEPRDEAHLRGTKDPGEERRPFGRLLPVRRGDAREPPAGRVAPQDDVAVVLLERGTLLERRGDLDVEALLGEGPADPDGPGVRIGGVADQDHGATTLRGRRGPGGIRRRGGLRSRSRHGSRHAGASSVWRVDPTEPPDEPGPSPRTSSR